MTGSSVATALSQRFNATVDGLLSQVSGVRIIRFDIFDLVRQLHDDPAAFGLTNSTQPCYTGFVNPAGPSDTVCANPQSYAYWDAEHPTTTVHSILADRMLTQVNLAAVPEPAQWASMLAGLAALGFFARRRRVA